VRRGTHFTLSTLHLSVVLLLASGCVRRQLTIRTEPPGAMVYVNDQLKGESPVAYDFTWYGHYRLTLRKDGFARVDDQRLLRAPIYLWIPLDLVMEVLPLTITDRRTWDYTLTPAAAMPEPTPPELGRQEPAEAPTPIAAPTEETPDAAR